MANPQGFASWYSAVRAWLLSPLFYKIDLGPSDVLAYSLALPLEWQLRMVEMVWEEAQR